MCVSLYGRDIPDNLKDLGSLLCKSAQEINETILYSLDSLGGGR